MILRAVKLKLKFKKQNSPIPKLQAEIEENKYDRSLAQSLPSKTGCNQNKSSLKRTSKVFKPSTMKNKAKIIEEEMCKIISGLDQEKSFDFIAIMEKLF